MTENNNPIQRTPTPLSNQNPNQNGIRKNHSPSQNGIKKAPKRSGSFQYAKFGARKKPKTNEEETPNKVLPRQRKTNNLPAVAPGNIRIIPLGGVEEIGKNMTAIEIGDDIIVIDAGMQFSTDDTPGADYIIPNTTYLEERKDRIRAMIVTHGHLDHIGGIPLVMNRIGNPPLYSRYLTTLMIEKRQSEFPQFPKLKINIVEKNEIVRVGQMKIRFFGVTHTIPDSMGIIIETPYGSIVNPGDYKLDQIDGKVTDSEEEEYAFFDKENVLALMTDSTNIENEGFALAEIKVHEGLERLIMKTTGRVILAAFASHLTRLMRVIYVAEQQGRKVVLEGRSMKTNLDICIQAGLLNPKKDTIIPIEDVDKYPPNKIIVLMTGAQGEEFAALNRVANKSHKKFSLKKGDTIILSASVIPGNEKAIEKVKDSIARQGVKIISYRTGEDDVHATGHGNQEDIKWLHRKVHPKFFIPIHGNHYRLRLHADLAQSLGMSEENIVVPDNGSLIEIQENGTKIVTLKEKAPSAMMIVDGFSVSDEQGVVLRDRQMLAQDGMFVVIATIDSRTGKLKKSPDLISRGFVYLKENQELLRQARNLIKKTIDNNTTGPISVDLDYIKNDVGETLSKFLFQKTAKRPLVIPVILTL